MTGNWPAAIPPPRRVADILAWIVSHLEAQWHDESSLLAEHLLSRAIGCRRLELNLHYNSALSSEADSRIRKDVSRLNLGEPLQYVLGDADFMGHIFRVDRRALIPRPETEQLVEMALGDSGLWSRPAPLVCDVGTGTGCIAAALALERPRSVWLATDRSPDALALASENLALHGLQPRVQLLCCDLLSGFAEATLDGVVANLPYVKSPDWALLPRHIRDHEPRLALDGGLDGLDLIRRLITQARRVIKPGGRIFLEIGADQGEAVAMWLTREGFQRVAIQHDLAGHARVVHAQRPNGGESAGESCR